MSNESITIVSAPTSVTVQPGKLTGSKLWFQAPGLDIYIIGDDTVKRHHAVAYQATLETASRHIPVLSLRYVGRRSNPRTVKIDKSQKRMF